MIGKPALLSSLAGLIIGVFFGPMTSEECADLCLARVVDALDPPAGSGITPTYDFTSIAHGQCECDSGNGCVVLCLETADCFGSIGFSVPAGGTYGYGWVPGGGVFVCVSGGGAMTPGTLNGCGSSVVLVFSWYQNDPGAGTPDPCDTRLHSDRIEAACGLCEGYCEGDCGKKH